MPKIKRSFFSAVLLAALCSPFAIAQNDPGSLEDLLGADFAPLSPVPQLKTPDLEAPLNLPAPSDFSVAPREPGSLPSLESPVVPESAIAPDYPASITPRQSTVPRSVLEIPRVTMDEPAPESLVLPDLTVPTPENSAADFRQGRTVLRPQLEPQRRDNLQLLPFDSQESIQTRTPRLQAPQPLPYGTYGNRTRTESARSRLMSIPIQVEFYSVRGSYGYQPYGGFVPQSYGYGSGYRSGYRPYGGYGYRPNNGYRGGRNCPNGGRW